MPYYRIILLNFQKILKKTYKIIEKHYSNYIKDNILEYKRIPQTKGFDHNKKVLEECNYEFMTLLHDDDTIYPEYIENVFKIFSLRPDLSAVAVNGNCEFETSSAASENMEDWSHVRLNRNCRRFRFFHFS